MNFVNFPTYRNPLKPNDSSKMLKTNHNRVIIHIDIDCFYAQVEEILNPELRTKNVGIQQKSCIVTCNYNARAKGVTKLMGLQEALQLCPDLVLVNGEDLTKYKQMSDRIFEVLSSRYTHQIEKLGMDENFLDVTKLLDNYSAAASNAVEKSTFIESSSCDGELECDCGCYKRLKIGTHIAKEMRQTLFDELGITTCAGIAYNKQLAKLIGSRNKPNKQTVIFDSAVSSYMRSLESVRKICGIGHKMAEQLESFGIKTVADLQDFDLELLKKKLDIKTAEKLKNWANGIDSSEIRPTGKPKSLSIEDSTYGNPLKNLLEVETKFSSLLSKLLAVTNDDGRIPCAFRVTVRKTVDVNDLLRRESKQVPINKSAITGNNSEVIQNLLKTAMSLFKKITPENPFTITLLGVSFCKFQEEIAQKSLIEKFLSKDVPKMTQMPKIESLKPPTSSSPKPKKSSKILEWISKANQSSSNESCTSPPSKRIKISSEEGPSTSTSSINVPPCVDLSIFNSLPEDLQKELIQQWNTPKPSLSPPNKKPVKKNTLDHFFKPKTS